MDTPRDGSVRSVKLEPSWTLAVGWALVIFLLIRYRSQRRKVGNLPPGPRNWPIIGAFLEMEPRLHKSFEKLAAKYGPIVLFRLGVQTVVVVSSAEAAEELLKQKDLEFAHRATAMNRSLAKYIGFNSTAHPFANSDDQLKLLRKISGVEFFIGPKLRSSEAVRSREIAVMVDKIILSTESSKDNQDQSTLNAVSVRGVVTDMIRNVMFTLCFGMSFDALPPTDRLKNFPEVLAETLRFFDTFILTDFFPSLEWLDPQGLLKDFKTIQKLLNDFYGGILEDRRRLKENNRLRNISGSASDSKGHSSNFVDVLLKVQEEGGQISDDAVMGTVESMLIGGIDSTSGGIEWVLLELARHPELCSRLRAEIDTVVGEERPVEEADMQDMPFLSAVVTESFRLHPPVSFSFPHVNMKLSTLGGFNIPAGTAVLVNIYTIGHDPKIWKDPLQFNPDRFMEGGSSASGTSPSAKSVSLIGNGSNYNLLPFSSGRRKCPAFDMASVLLTRTVATFVHAFDWTLLPGSSPEDLSVNETGSFIPHPFPDLLLTLRPRLSRHVYQSKKNLS